MTPASPELIRIVHEDLTYLAANWPSGDVRDDEIRRSSALLRRLLTYKDIIPVWVSVVGQKDYLVSGAFVEVLHAKRLKEVDFATSSPANQGSGIDIMSVVAYNKIQIEMDTIRIIGREVSLKKYLNQTACVIYGVAISRDEIVQFVANKMGGAHFDAARQKPRDKSISAMEQYFVGNKSSLIHEILSYGQALASSPSTRELLRILNAR